jgi:hypothetical protein
MEITYVSVEEFWKKWYHEMYAGTTSAFCNIIVGEQNDF